VLVRGDVVSAVECDGMCLFPADLGFPEWDQGDPAYPDPLCSLHGFHEVEPVHPEEEEMLPEDRE
jgi:hypothetical protein